jgi:hypothetical protein
MNIVPLLLLPAIASAVIHTEEQQTVSVSSGGKLEASVSEEAASRTTEEIPVAPPPPLPSFEAFVHAAQGAMPSAVVRRASPKQLLTDSETSTSDATECIAWHNVTDVHHETFGSNSTAATAKYNILIQSDANHPNGIGAYATVHFEDDGIKNVYGQPTDKIRLELCNACSVTGALCVAAYRAHRVAATARSAALPETDADAGKSMVKREKMQRDGPLTDQKGESMQQSQDDKKELASMPAQKKETLKQRLDEAAMTLEKVLGHDHAETGVKRHAAQAPAVKRETSCIDGHANCQEWSSIGECNNNPGYMHKVCKAACGQCR